MTGWLVLTGWQDPTRVVDYLPDPLLVQVDKICALCPTRRHPRQLLTGVLFADYELWVVESVAQIQAMLEIT